MLSCRRVPPHAGHLWAPGPLTQIWHPPPPTLAWGSTHIPPNHHSHPKLQYYHMYGSPLPLIMLITCPAPAAPKMGVFSSRLAPNAASPGLEVYIHTLLNGQILPRCCLHSAPPPPIQCQWIHRAVERVVGEENSDKKSVFEECVRVCSGCGSIKNTQDIGKLTIKCCAWQEGM